MTLTNELKILDDKIKADPAQYDLSREAAKISAFSSKDLLEKDEYLTGEDLGHKPSVFEKDKFEYSPLGISLSEAFKKNEVKTAAKSKSDFNYNNNHTFYRFYKGHDKFEEMSLDSKYNRMKELNKLLISFKSVKTKKAETRLKKEQIMKNVDELYKKYYNTYKSDYDTDDELKGTKKKKFDHKQFQLDNKINKESKRDEKVKELKLTALTEWLSSKNDFNEARKLINDIKADTNKVRSSSGDEKVFSNLNGLINDIKNKKTIRKSVIKKNKWHYF